VPRRSRGDRLNNHATADWLGPGRELRAGQIPAEAGQNWVCRAPEPRLRRTVDAWIEARRHAPVLADFVSVPRNDNEALNYTYWWARIPGTEHGHRGGDNKLVACRIIVSGA
jgi:hypothetical protein